MPQFILFCYLTVLTFLSIPMIHIYHFLCYEMILPKYIYINPSFFHFWLIPETKKFQTTSRMVLFHNYACSMHSDFFCMTEVFFLGSVCYRQIFFNRSKFKCSFQTSQTQETGRRAALPQLLSALAFRTQSPSTCQRHHSDWLPWQMCCYNR